MWWVCNNSWEYYLSDFFSEWINVNAEGCKFYARRLSFYLWHQFISGPEIEPKILHFIEIKREGKFNSNNIWLLNVKSFHFFAPLLLTHTFISFGFKRSSRCHNVCPPGIKCIRELHLHLSRSESLWGAIRLWLPMELRYFVLFLLEGS